MLAISATLAGISPAVKAREPETEECEYRLLIETKKGGGEVGGSTLNTQSTGKSDLFVGAQPLRHHSAVSAKSRRPVLRDRYNNQERWKSHVYSVTHKSL